MKKIRHFIVLLLLISIGGGVQAQEKIPRIEDLDLDSIQEVLQDPSGNGQLKKEKDDSDDKDEVKREFLTLDAAPSDSFRLRQISEAKLKEQREDADYWYANASLKKVEEKQNGETSFLFSPGFQAIMWVLVIAGFITVLAIFLMNGNVGIFRRSRAITQEVSGPGFEDIFSINYQAELDKAIASGQYNLAVRLLFLRLLRSLSERNIIDYKQDRTNFDYLTQLQRSRYYQDFFRLTRHYEYSWYGQFPLEKEKLEMIRKEFENFDRNLN